MKMAKRNRKIRSNRILIIFYLNLFVSVCIWGQSINDYVIKQCNRLGVPVEVAMAILVEENPGLDFEAVHLNRNGSQDMGLWQLNDRWLWSDFIPRYWNRMDIFQWNNPFHSTYIAIRHIKWLYSQGFNHWQVILAYNCGYWSLHTGEVPNSSIEYANRVYARIRFTKASRKYAK